MENVDLRILVDAQRDDIEHLGVVA